jgi:alkylhydroperoxidase family enzyme
VARVNIPDGEGGDAVQVWMLRPEMGAAVAKLSDAAYNKSILPTRVREAARMRIAQLNECKVCLNFRADSVKEEAATDEDFYAHVASFHDDSRYSPREKMAIDYAERFVVAHTAIDDAFFEQLHEHFTDEEILDLTICIAAFVALGRTLNVLGIEDTSLTDVTYPSSR